MSVSETVQTAGVTSQTPVEPTEDTSRPFWRVKYPTIHQPEVQHVLSFLSKNIW